MTFSSKDKGHITLHTKSSKGKLEEQGRNRYYIETDIESKQNGRQSLRIRKQESLEIDFRIPKSSL